MTQPSASSTHPDTALLVIDLQRGAFDGVRCTPIDAPDALIDGASALIEAARAGHVPVVFIQHCGVEAGGAFEEGSPHWDLHAALVPAADELVMRKYASSSFEQTDLDRRLRARNVGQLVLCGLQSEFCVSNTAHAALALGYRVQVAGDAHSTWPSDASTAATIRDAANAALARAGATVLPVDRLVGALRSGRP